MLDPSKFGTVRFYNFFFSFSVLITLQINTHIWLFIRYGPDTMDLEEELNSSSLYPYTLRIIVLERLLKLFQEFIHL